MKFDDRLSTVLRVTAPTGQAAVAQYRQLVDILGQADEGDLPIDTVATGLSRIHQLHGDVPAADRLVAVQSLAGRLRSPVLLHYLASDRPQIANAAILSARLSDRQWTAIIPDLPVRARGFLRNRRDLGPAAMQTLAAYGPGDLALPASLPVGLPASLPASSNVEPEAVEILQAVPQPVISSKDIGQIVARIEAFRKDRTAAEPAQLPLGDAFIAGPVEPLSAFAFATDASGAITYADVPVPGAIVGMNIAQIAENGLSGVDGYAAAAFRQRMPIKAARLEMCGGAAVAGSWRIEAEPQFDGTSGRFTGYHGRIRRPDAGEMAAILPDQHDGGEIRQIIHELRTPLGAILGFAEIIEQQLFGPASHDYRSLAAEITRNAHYLLGGFEDLDTALKLDGGQWQSDSSTGSSTASGDWLVERIEQRLQPYCITRGVTFEMQVSPQFTGLDMAEADSERVVLRLLSTMVAVMSPPEVARVRIDMSPDGDAALIAINIPEALAGNSADALLDPEYGLVQDMDDAPLMGIGFSLRLVRSLADNHGGALRFERDGFTLRLPALAPEYAARSVI